MAIRNLTKNSALYVYKVFICLPNGQLMEKKYFLDRAEAERACLEAEASGYKADFGKMLMYEEQLSALISYALVKLNI